METVHNRDYNNIPIGLAVRGSINDEYTYRVRPGNGFYDAKKGKVYQDKYAYFVPGSINNAASQPYRQQWIAAVHKWKEDLSDADKQQYNHIAMRGLHMSGYNLFMRRAMKGEIDMYVDRGDPAAYDYAKEDLDLDGAWHDLDLCPLFSISASGSVGPRLTFSQRKSGPQVRIQKAQLDALSVPQLLERSYFVEAYEHWNTLTIENKADWTAFNRV